MPPGAIASTDQNSFFAGMADSSGEDAEVEHEGWSLARGSQPAGPEEDLELRFEEEWSRLSERLGVVREAMLSTVPIVTMALDVCKLKNETLSLRAMEALLAEVFGACHGGEDVMEEFASAAIESVHEFHEGRRSQAGT